MRTMPVLDTGRCLIRPLVMEDLQAVHQILDIDAQDVDLGSEGAKELEARRQWLEWSILNYEQLARLYQPPYGERALALKDGGRLIGAVGLAPALDVFEQLPFYSEREALDQRRLARPEVGLFYALGKDFRRQGYASEAARALVQYAFAGLNLRRVIATTTYDNVGSIAVMQKIGMRIERNPYPDPPWLQVVGIIENPAG